MLRCKRQGVWDLVPAADVAGSLLFLFILIIWAADDAKNMSVHIGLLLLGSLISLFPIMGSGLDIADIVVAVLPGMALLMGKIAGAKVGGADVWVVFVSGISSGAVLTVRAVVIGLIIFVLIKHRGKGAFLPFFLLGYMGALLI